METFLRNSIGELVHLRNKGLLIAGLDEKI
jgi:hypothetical protein